MTILKCAILSKASAGPVREYTGEDASGSEIGFFLKVAPFSINGLGSTIGRAIAASDDSQRLFPTLLLLAHLPRHSGHCCQTLCIQISSHSTFSCKSMFIIALILRVFPHCFNDLFGIDGHGVIYQAIGKEKGETFNVYTNSRSGDI